MTSSSVNGVTEFRRGPLQDFVEHARCYSGLPRHAHKPQFSLVRMDEPRYRETYSWIMDGDQKIGLLNLSFGEIEILRFFPPEDGARVEYDMPAAYSWVNLRGARISIVPQGTWSDRVETVTLQDRGDVLRWRFTQKYSGNSQMVHQIALRFDPVLGYMLDCQIDIRMDTPGRYEYANILAGGLSECRESRKRFQKCVWTRRDGAFCRMYQNPLSLMQKAGPEWNSIPERGFVGWVAEPDMNPFLDIARSTPAAFVTCDMWYDQHVFGLPPEEREEDGQYHIRADYRFLSLPLPVAGELEDAAQLMLPEIQRGLPLGFRMGVVNDFEEAIPPGTLYNGCQWTRMAEWDREIGRSGTASLRLSGAGEAEPIFAGPAVIVEPGRRYRMSAWVRTRGVTGKGALLRIKEVYWGWEDIRALHVSKSITGDNDWTRLELEFEPEEYERIAVPGLVLEGGGTAWFDDVELAEIPPATRFRHG